VIPELFQKTGSIKRKIVFFLKVKMDNLFSSACLIIFGISGDRDNYLVRVEY
jgi:hypothetical protein